MLTVKERTSQWNFSRNFNSSLPLQRKGNYHYSSNKPQKIKFYKFTSGLTFNHWLDCSLAKLQNVNDINSRLNKVT